MDLFKPIPLRLPSLKGWTKLPIKENQEKLVPLGPFSKNSQIFTSSIYSGERKDSPYYNHPLKGSLITVFVRESVALQLKMAQSLLPKGLCLVVLDGYRRLEVQQSIYDTFYKELLKQHPNWSNSQLSLQTQKYVSLPSNNKNNPSPHNTGGAIDLVIIKLSPMKQLDFGTPFDFGGEEATLNYYEKRAAEKSLTDKKQIILKNRRLLYNVMTFVGFEPFQYEWWHYNSRRSQMGAKTAGLKLAEFGAANLSLENLQHEEMRTTKTINYKRSNWQRSTILKPVK